MVKDAAQPSSRIDGGSQIPSIVLPKGGGALRSIAEKLGVSPALGTGAMTLPIAAPPDRSGASPSLTLTYDSARGNGVFGLGWHLSVAAITRKTEKGLPAYRDADESDVFLFSDAEDLVPASRHGPDGWSTDQFFAAHDGLQHEVKRYRPRTESTFTRIERWTRTSDGVSFWLTVSKDNVTSWYGQGDASRIVDPSDATRIFSWLLDRTEDDRGNATVFEYQLEDSAGVIAAAHEVNRGRDCNRHLKTIRYGNHGASWQFHVVFDYGDHDARTPKVDRDTTWLPRRDAFSTYRAGFEIRTRRLCRRVLVFHDFAELGGEACLVRSTDFTYDEDPVGSTLTSARNTYYTRDGQGYLAESLPALELGYSRAVIDQTPRTVDLGDNLPYGVDDRVYQWVDLDSEGSPGILTEQGGGWFYKRNISNIPAATTGVVSARFDASEWLAPIPSSPLAGGRRQFIDLAGEGTQCLVDLEQHAAGYFRRTGDRSWDPFVPFAQMPRIDWQSPYVRHLDLDGDGFPDVLVSEDEVFTWYPSLGKGGFGSPATVRRPLDEDDGPALVLADPTGSIYVADLTGDGLSDIVRIRNGEICYWPNLGFGRFGAKVTMSNAPWFDTPELFDERRLRLVDLDGAGTTDLIYLGRERITLYFNQSGNGWSDGHALTELAAPDDLSSVTAIDLLGNGTACLVWSNPLPGAEPPMTYVDLMGGQKPHLLISAKNNLGSETTIHYVASTQFYLQDRRAGTPWVTRLPFPVHVVDRVDLVDTIGGNRVTTRYAYHHGYYDGTEREFRGFGLVETWDSEAHTSLLADDGATLDQAPALPPVYTKTWYHTGAWQPDAAVTTQLASAYWREPALSDAEHAAMCLPDSELPAAVVLGDGTELPWSLSIDEQREALRALKGRVLRQETYGLDGTPLMPYAVAEHTYRIALLQPLADNRHAVFFVHARESIDSQYERALYTVAGEQRADPRRRHSVTLAVDAWGNTSCSATVTYGRRYAADEPLFTAEDHAVQKATHVTFDETRYTTPLVTADTYRGPLACETRSYHLLHVDPGTVGTVVGLLRFDALAKAVSAAGDGHHDVPYEDVAAGGAVTAAPYRRLLACSRTLFRKDDLSGPLPLGVMESRAILHERYRLALTPGLLGVFGTKLAAADAAAVLTSEGGLRDLDGDGNLWVPSGQILYSPDPAHPDVAFAQQHFFLPQGFVDAFGNRTQLAWDGYDLLPTSSRTMLGNTTTAEYDYRVLQPAVITDPNGNRVEIAFSRLGVVAGTAVRGKINTTEGDSLDGFVADPSAAECAAFFADPLGQAAALLGNATMRTIYDPYRYETSRLPGVVAVLKRETHVSDLAAGEVSRVQIELTYRDGRGRDLQRKTRAEPGPVVPGGPAIAPRWVASGWTVLDDKDRPVQQFEPFFSATHECELAVTHGVALTFIYDPLGRRIGTLHPDHSYEKVVFDPWMQQTWDRNDNVAGNPVADTTIGRYAARLASTDYLPTWLERRFDPAYAAQAWPDPKQRAAESAAATQTLAHAATPTTSCLDALGRVFANIADNGVAGRQVTRMALDISGNQLAVRDPLGRVVMRQDYDALATSIHQIGMDFGERLILLNAAGAPLRAWDSRDHELRHVYDELLRPRQLFVRTGGGGESLVEEVIYGESYGQSPADGAARNLLTRIYESHDGSGIATSSRYDFKGNLLEGTRQLLRDLVETPNWTASPPLADEVFTSNRRYDALDRPIQGIAPHSSAPGTRFDIVQPTYNEANLLERVDVWQQQVAAPGTLLDSATATLRAVTGIDYDAKGQRLLVEYGNGVATTYSYDAETFRLRNVTTLRARDNVTLQDLRYTTDPVGNVTNIEDDADIQDVVYFKNQRVDPSASYVYDPLYRLVSATGREHLGQTGGQLNPPQQVTDIDALRTGMASPSDGNAMGRYTETYSYDAVGNLLSMVHGAASGSWTRRYAYNEPSAVEPEKAGNRLSATSMPGDADGGPYTGVYGSYDPHGNMGAMPHLAALDWNFKDQLAAVNLGGGGVCSYSYDAAGQRVRKVWQKSAALSEERIVLNGWELFRRRSGGMLVVERQTLHLFDGTRRIAVIDTTTVDDTGPPSALVRFQLGNHLDSALLELDEHGDVISYEEYYPFGSTSYQAGRTVTEVSLKRYRHMAKERDDESGLYYYGARYYAPWLGRWTSCDPERLKDGLSVYVFTRNRPVTLVDVGGHESAPPFISRYLTDVLPPIMSVLNKHGIPPDRAIWLVVQAWSEQGPSLGLPSNSDNRIFNQQFTLKDLEGTYTEAQIKDIDARLKKGETVDLGGGVKVRNILQNESTDLAHKKMKVSPTYVYDNLEASVEHHLTMLGRRFAKARADLSDSTKTVGDFFKDLHTYGHVPDEAQQHERTQRIRDGKPLEEKHMFYDELVMQKRLGTVTDNLKKWDMNELDAKLNGMYSTVASLAADYGALQTQYAELYKEFEKTGDPDIAARLGQIKAEQQQIQRNAKGVLAEADALLAVRDQLKAAIKGLP